MKKIALVFTLLFLISCKKESVTSTTAWLDNMIKAGSDSTGKFISAYSYQYNGKTVYLVNYQVVCCDNYTSQLFDSQGNSLCFPYGGISGQGNQKCLDFDLSKTNEKLYWKV